MKLCGHVIPLRLELGGSQQAPPPPAHLGFDALHRAASSYSGPDTPSGPCFTCPIWGTCSEKGQEQCMCVCTFFPISRVEEVHLQLGAWLLVILRHPGALQRRGIVWQRLLCSWFPDLPLFVPSTALGGVPLCLLMPARVMS